MDAPVIVVGGGPVGLCLGLGLAHHGVRSIVLERLAEPVAESRALLVWPRTLEILRDWGACEAVRAAGQFATLFAAYDARSERRLVGFDFRCVADVVDDPGYLIIPQYATERALRDLAERNQLCDLRTGVEVLGLAQDANGVDVRMRDSSGERTLRAAYVAGCDGAHGVARKSIALSLEGATYPMRAVLTDELLPESSSALRSPRIAIDRPGLLFAVEYASRRWRVISTIAPGVDEAEALSDAAHAERLRDLFGEVPTQTIWQSYFQIHRRHAARFVVGRVALAGDAAHLNSPAGGEGMNAGIHDSANLAWKLAYARRGDCDAEALLSSYDVERREMVTDTVERQTDRMTAIAFKTSPRFKRIGLALLARAVRGFGMQRKLCRSFGMLGGRYTKSPLVDARHPLAGRRIDDLLIGGSRINHLRNGRSAVIAVGAVDPVVEATLRIAAAPKRWHVKPPVVLVVRPDGCVAAVVEKPTRERVDAALKRSFAEK